MYRIDDATASATLPIPEAAGTEGYWTEGNPATNTPATLERASWFNMVQEELRAIVVAGGLTPSKTAYTQVLTAIQTIVGNGRPTIWTATDTGAANAYAATLSPAPSAYAADQVVVLLVGHTNTGASTFNGVAIEKVSAGSLVALAAGDIQAGGFVILAHDGTRFVLVNAAATLGSLAALGIGDGVENDGAGNLRVKLNGATLARAAGGMSLNLGSANAWGAAQSASPVTITDGASPAINLALGNVCVWTLGGNRTMPAPSNPAAGQSGVIWLTQDGTGGRTLAYNTFWKFAGGFIPTLSTAASAVDALVYEVNAAGTYAACALVKGIA